MISLLRCYFFVFVMVRSQLVKNIPLFFFSEQTTIKVSITNVKINWQESLMSVTLIQIKRTNKSGLQL